MLFRIIYRLSIKKMLPKFGSAVLRLTPSLNYLWKKGDVVDWLRIFYGQ